MREEGFVRAIIGERVVNLDEVASGQYSVLSTQYSVLSTQSPSGGPSESVEPAYVVVDRLAAGGATEQRVRDSLETAFGKGLGKCFAFVENGGNGRGTETMIDGRAWRRLAFSNTLACADCGIEYVPPEPRLFSFNSPLGACPNCEGFGNIIGVDMDLVVPDPSKTLREGAIAPWNTPAYAHELEELLALAPDYDLPVNVPFSKLTAAQRKLIKRGVPKRNFGGLDGFFAWLAAAEVQDAHPRLPEPLAELPPLPGLRRRRGCGPRPSTPASAAATSPRSPPCRSARRPSSSAAWDGGQV